MSPSKLNSLLTGTLVAIIIAVSGSVMAQDALRLWKPYSPESFGGGRRSNDGVYSSVSGIYWSLSAPGGGYIGATTVKGKDETRLVYDIGSAKLRAQTNSARINMMNTPTTLGTRFEVGNRRGHHGWLVSGYGLYSQSRNMTAQNVSMAIRDEGRFDAPVGQAVLDGAQNVGYLWGPNYGTVSTMMYIDQGVAGPNTTGWLPNPVSGEWMFYIGPGGTQSGPELDSRTVYAYIPVGSVYYLPEMSDEPGPAVFAPLPVVFEDVSVNVRSQHMSAELMYTYRMHPFTWGAMELLAGVRYWDLDDEFGFDGTNVVDDVTVDAIRAFENMRVAARGYNHVFGPQFGIKLSRQNARWTFGAEGRLAGGINMQTVKTEGYVTPNADYTPIGLQASSNNNFGHKQHKTYFSPIGELRLSADWQWTSAVSFFGAVDGMFAGNIARGVRITDYSMHSNGKIFGIRGNDRNTSVAVYGVETGIKVRR